MNLRADIFYFLFWLGFCSCIQVRAQQEVDSLKHLLNTTKSDSVKINTLVDLAFYTYQVNLKEAVDYVGKAYVIAKKTNDKYALALCLNVMGNLQMEMHNHSRAVELYKQSLALSKELNDIQNVTKALGNIGLVYEESGDFAKAFNYQYQCLALVEKEKDYDGLGTVYNNIGNLFYEQENYDKALEFHNKSLKIRESLNDKQGIVTSLNNIGTIYDAQKQIDTAISIHEKALKIEIEIGDKYGMAYSYNNIGGLFEQKKLRERALAFYLKSLSIREEINDDEGIASCLLNIGILNRKFKKYKEANESLQKALDITLKTGKKSLLKDIYAELSTCSIELGNFKDGYNFHKLYSAVKDSLFNIDATEEVANIRFQYEFDKKEAVAKLEQENKEILYGQEKKQQKIIIYSISGGLLLLCLLTVFIYRGYRTKQKSNIQLESMNKIIVEKNKNITDSINYARRIQTALMTSEKYIDKAISRLAKKK